MIISQTFYMRCMYIFTCKEINEFTLTLPDFPKKLAKLIYLFVAHEYVKELLFTS